MSFNLTPQLPANGLTVLELFCGGGLGAIGFKAAGYEIIKALDFDKNAVAAYRHNFGDYVEQADISSVDIGSLPNADVIFGGPPCQDYSVAGNGEGEEGERGKLVFRYLDIIAAKQPKAFVFENVKGLIGKRHRHTFDALLSKFSEIGYEVSWQLINAWDYGVAQKRERVFIVGVRQDLSVKFEFPTPMEGDYRTKVLRDVIRDLPDPHPEERNPQDGRYSSQFLSRNRVVGWESPAYTVLTSPRDASIHPGDGDLTMDVVRERTEKHYSSPKSDSEQPFHPSEAPRRFTVREALRIQSVPDTYVLPDSISLSAQYRIVGNGIASRVAWYIGKALADQLPR
ncbi:DNA cytosine methyltransferase [Bacillus sp. JJ1503]|uniref:DNA cytosine methyltransferase n=1 Tax=Bacillus sp. JJ1503 TaxID=3122956 RepID=UPI002FFF5C74